MKKLWMILLVLSVCLFGMSCSANNLLEEGTALDSIVATDDPVLNAEIAEIMSIYAEAFNSDDPELVVRFENALSEFDSKYNGTLAKSFKETKNSVAALSSSGSSSFPLLTDLPIKKDGDVYLSGGSSDIVGSIIGWVAPTTTPGKVYHGAVLDYDKFDPTDLESQCFQTAILKGAGYESPKEWMSKPNVTVLTPTVTLDKAKLNTAQANLHAYCRPDNKNMQYGFFKSYVNIFSLVEKSDNYYWYCTKVVWRVFSQLGIDIDSNSPKVDWTTSGLYSIVKTYYNTLYFWSSSKAKENLNAYINNAIKTIVLAEEIYYSPYMKKIYEVVRSK